MTENDRQKFSQLMIMMAEVSVGNEFKRPSADKIQMYYNLLSDLSFDIIKLNAEKHFRKNKWFPAISELRGESDEKLKIKAQESFKILNDVIEKYYVAGFACTCDIVEQKLKAMNREDLISDFYKWGTEIVNNSNPTATRAQFLNAYVAHKIIASDRQIETGNKSKQLGEIIKKIEK